MPVETVVGLADERATEPKLLHVRMPRTVERVHPRSPDLQVELMQQVRKREDRSAHLQGQREEFGIELSGDRDGPAHGGNMFPPTYNVIPCSCPGRLPMTGAT